MPFLQKEKRYCSTGIPDIGGATTDVYSMSDGAPTIENVMVKGLPEPYSKRTVEGDLGMRYSLTFLADEVDDEILATELGIDKTAVSEWVKTCSSKPETLAQAATKEQEIEEGLARNAIKIAVERHCGIFQPAYTPWGQIFTLTGKDLSDISHIIGIGGVIINSRRPQYILEGAKADATHYKHAKPKNPNYMLDEKYIFAAMGLLSSVNPELAFTMMKKEIKEIKIDEVK